MADEGPLDYLVVEPSPSRKDWESLSSKIDLEQVNYEENAKLFLKKARFIELDLNRTILWIVQFSIDSKALPAEVDYGKLGRFLHQLLEFRFSKQHFVDFHIYKNRVFNSSSQGTFLERIQTVLTNLKTANVKTKKGRLSLKLKTLVSKEFLENKRSESLYFLSVPEGQNIADDQFQKECGLILPDEVRLFLDKQNNENLQRAVQVFLDEASPERKEQKNILFGTLPLHCARLLSIHHLEHLVEPLLLSSPRNLLTETEVDSLIEVAKNRDLTTSEVSQLTEVCLKNKSFNRLTGLLPSNTIPAQVAKNLVVPDRWNTTLLEIVVNRFVHGGQFTSFSSKHHLISEVSAHLPEPQNKLLLQSHFPKQDKLGAILAKYIRSSPAWSKQTVKQECLCEQLLTQHNLTTLTSKVSSYLSTSVVGQMSEEYIREVVADLSDASQLLAVTDLDKFKRPRLSLPRVGRKTQAARRFLRLNRDINSKAATLNHFKFLKLLKQVFSSHSVTDNFLSLAMQLREFGCSNKVDGWLRSWLRSHLISSCRIESALRKIKHAREISTSDEEFRSNPLVVQFGKYLEVSMAKLSTFPELRQYIPLGIFNTAISQYLLYSRDEPTSIVLYENLIKLGEWVEGTIERPPEDENHPISEIRSAKGLLLKRHVLLRKLANQTELVGAEFKKQVMWELGLTLLPNHIGKSAMLRLMLDTDSSGRRYLETVNLTEYYDLERKWEKIADRSYDLVVRFVIGKAENWSWGRIKESLLESVLKNEPCNLYPASNRSLFATFLGDNKRQPCRESIIDEDTNYSLHELQMYYLSKAYSNFRPESLKETSARYFNLLMPKRTPAVKMKPTIGSTLPEDFSFLSANLSVLATKLDLQNYSILLEKIGNEQAKLSEVLVGTLVSTSTAKLNILSEHLIKHFHDGASKELGALFEKTGEYLAEGTKPTPAAVLSQMWTSVYHLCREVRLASTGYLDKEKGQLVPKNTELDKGGAAFAAWHQNHAHIFRISGMGQMYQVLPNLSSSSWKLLLGLATQDESFSKPLLYKDKDSRVQEDSTSSQVFSISELKEHTDSKKEKQIDLLVKLLRTSSRLTYGSLFKELHQHQLLVKYLPLLSQLCPVASAWKAVFEDRDTAQQVLVGLLARMQGETQEDTGMFQFNRYQKTVFREDIIGQGQKGPPPLSKDILAPGFVYVGLFAVSAHPDLEPASEFVQYLKTQNQSATAYFRAIRKFLAEQTERHPTVISLFEHFWELLVAPFPDKLHSWMIPEINVDKILRAKLGQAHISLPQPDINDELLKAISEDASLREGYFERKILLNGKCSARAENTWTHIKISKKLYQTAAKEIIERESNFGEFLNVINSFTDLVNDTKLTFSSLIKEKLFSSLPLKEKLRKFKLVTDEETLDKDDSVDATIPVSLRLRTQIKKVYINALSVPVHLVKPHGTYFVAANLRSMLELLSYRTKKYLPESVLNQYMAAPKEAFYACNTLNLPKAVRKCFGFRLDINQVEDFYNQMDYQEALLQMRISQVLELAEEALLKEGDNADPLVKYSALLGGSTAEEITHNCYKVVESAIGPK